MEPSAGLPDFETIAVSVDADGRRGAITLSRPSKLNAMSPTMLAEIIACAAWFDTATDAVSVVVHGSGRSFCAGFDLGAFREQREPGDARDTADLGRRMADAVTGMRAVTVAAIHGHCVGGGLVLAASCDLRIAEADASFSIPEVDLGIPLAWGGIPRLVREIGPAATKDLVMTCRAVGADEAQRLGLVTRVVDAGGAHRAAVELSVELSQKSPLVLSMTKQHVNAIAEHVGSTSLSFFDADALSAAQRDPASRAAGRAYLGRRA